mmetsp:Transcript_29592/g.68434  ORF Transcript_29592/g.68434 Transcript_29592/m.68434 type:complete len:174 (-) Transcript_29592:105-626(-)|eukprot:CAMPEP_0116852982 /NCGR_PEP_ID=MMETSP0418-20121206/17626_1 /TAXON_ID=1158023 /ORGANISM="Astrosyne radiata, Strain 13vi08-1A" /LENGTH=173 /DNA_ID=CAMNT_0004485267 /DNA_START=34 /DNA_END=555 /DNA_ORIENTATION=+
MADAFEKPEAEMTEEEILAERRKRAFKKFQFKGKDLDSLLDMTNAELVRMLPSRIQRKFRRMTEVGPDAPKFEVRNVLKYTSLLKRLRKSKDECGLLDKPKLIRTHLRNAVVLPDMVGCNVGVYNGRHLAVVEVRPEMIGHYLGELSITYKPTLHGRPGVALAAANRFVPLHG